MAAEDLRSDETKFWHGQIDKAVAVEREACARVVHDYWAKNPGISAQAMTDIMRTIRARLQ